MMKLCKSISSMINSFCVNEKKEFTNGIIEYPLAKAVFLNISLVWIKQLAGYYDLKYMYDDRNKESVEICKKVSEQPIYQELYKFYIGRTPIKEYSRDEVFRHIGDEGQTIKNIVVQYISHDHRTLIQTFNGIVFTFLKDMGNSDIGRMFKNMVNDKLITEEFNRFTMI